MELFCGRRALVISGRGDINAGTAEVSVFTGEVTVHKAGTARITAQSAEGDNYLPAMASYRIPLEAYQVLFDPKLAEYFYRKAGLWGGNCYGLSTSSLMFNMAGSGVTVRSFQASAQNVSDLKLTDFYGAWEMSLLKFIEAAQVAQYHAAI